MSELEVYTRVEFDRDLAECVAIRAELRRVHALGAVSGLKFNPMMAQVDALEKQAKAKWGRSSRVFDTLRRAKAALEVCTSATEEQELVRKIGFLKMLCSQILAGKAKKAESEPPMPEAWDGPRPWVRERRNLTVRPELELEICIGGTWRPISRDQLPCRVRWIEEK